MSTISNNISIIPTNQESSLKPSVKRKIDIPARKLEKNGDFHIPFTPAQVTAYTKEINEASEKRKKLKARIESINKQTANIGNDFEVLMDSIKSSPISGKNKTKQLMMIDIQNRYLNEPDPIKQNPKKAAKIKEALELRKRRLAQLSAAKDQ